MESTRYFTTADLAAQHNVTSRTICDVASVFESVITSFGRKKGIRRLFTQREALAIKYVFDGGKRNHKKSYGEALRLYFNVEWDR